ncbi:MAG: amino acid permease [Candidatus Wallbacteria bacterium]|nr:amino acid permease [Candidatus Wallbacteria bacterium]
MTEDTRGAGAERQTHGLQRRLGLFDLICLGLNSVIGSGIFLSPGLIAGKLGSLAAAAFAAGGVLCLAIAYCFAEMASMFPRNGGACAYAREAFGPFTGFLVGWVMWLSCLVGGAAVAVSFGEMLARRLSGLAAAVGLPLDATPAMATTLACAVIVILAMVNLRGARHGAASNNGLALLKLAPLSFFALWALPEIDEKAIPGLGTPGVDLLGGLLLVLYTFSGFEEIPVPAGETRDAEQNVPQALGAVLVLATGFYVVIQAAVVSLGGAGSATPLEDAASGSRLLSLVVAASSLAALASVNASIAFTGPRSLWVLAADGWMPAALARLSAGTGAPRAAVFVTSGLTLALCASGTFETLAVLSVLASLLQYLPTILGVLVLRRTRPDLPRPVRIPYGNLIPVTALAVCLLLLSTSHRSYLVGAAVALAIGAAVGAPRLLASRKRSETSA